MEATALTSKVKYLRQIASSYREGAAACRSLEARQLLDQAAKDLDRRIIAVERLIGSS